MGLFDSYLTVWVFLCILTSIMAGLADDQLHAAQGCRRTLAWRQRNAACQLGGEAVFHGTAGLVVHRRAVSALVAGRPDQQPYHRAFRAIAARNFFQLAVATAIALFGFQSGAALATVVGVLIEVPVMLVAVGIVIRTRG